METIVRNSLLFISGFMVALAIFRSPLNISSSFRNQLTPSYTSVDSKDASSYSKFDKSTKSNASDLAQRPRINNKLAKNSNFFFNSTSSSELSGTPDNAERIQEQVPTAPPTGRPEADNEETAENKDEKKETEAVAKYEPKRNYDYNPKDNEASLSSVSESNKSYVGAITEAPKSAQASNQGTAIRVSGGSSNPTIDENNTGSDVIPDDFTQAGFQTAKRLYTDGSLSEVEYLDYLSLGLNSSDSSLVSLALNEVAGLKNKNAFSILTQYANSSGANIQAINQAVVSKYRNAADLRFLSQMINDSSSQEVQSFAIHSLDIILAGSTMDFSNQQIKDTLVNNVGPSLVKIESGHPSFGLARDLSAEINRKLS